jgi:hypothetical protein
LFLSRIAEIRLLARAAHAVCNLVWASKSPWVDREGQEKPMALDDIIIVTPYNATFARASLRLQLCSPQSMRRRGPTVGITLRRYTGGAIVVSPGTAYETTRDSTEIGAVDDYAAWQKAEQWLKECGNAENGDYLQVTEKGASPEASN